MFSFCKALNETKIILYNYYESSFYVLNTANNMVSKETITIPVKRFLEETFLFYNIWIRDNTYYFDDLSFFLKDTVLLNRQHRKMEKSLGSKI